MSQCNDCGAEAETNRYGICHQCHEERVERVMQSLGEEDADNDNVSIGSGQSILDEW